MNKGWEVKRLGEVCDKASSNVSQNQLANEVGDYAIFGASGLIKNVSFYHQEKPYLSIVKDGSGVGRVTKMNAYTSIIGTLQYIIPKEGIDLDYLHYSLMSVDFKKYVAGAAIPHIYFKDYKNEPFLWMPLPEQKEIVAILDKAFAVIDKAKANVEKNLKNTREIFESYLSSIFNNKGAGWEQKELGEVCAFENGDRGTNYPSKSARTTTGIPFVNAGHLRDDGIDIESMDYISRERFDLLGSGKIRAGDILFCLRGSLGKVANVGSLTEGAIASSLVIIRPNNSVLNPFILAYLKSHLCAEMISKFGNGAAQPNLSAGSLKKFNLYVPTIPEQQIIIKRLDLLSAQTKRLESIYQQKLTNLEELKKSILQKAFAGELTSNNVEDKYS